MDEITKQALNEFVRKMLSAAEQGATWTIEQTPLLVQEWLRWQAVEAALWMSIFVPILVAAVWLGRKANENDWNDEWPCVPALLSIIGAFGYFAMAFLPNTFTLLKVLSAPRVVVLEKFMTLLK